VIQAVSITDCPVEPQLLDVLVKVKKILAKCLSHACVETRVSHMRTEMVCGCKMMMMMMMMNIAKNEKYQI